MPLDADIIKEEDTYRWEPTLENPRTGATYDLTNAAEVRLYVDHLRSDTLVVNSAVEIVDAANGQVAYDFSRAETARAGTHRAEFVVEESDGDYVTVPNDGYVKLDFTAMLPRGADLEPATADTDATVATLTATDWIESPVARLDSVTTEALAHRNAGYKRVSASTYAPDGETGDKQSEFTSGLQAAIDDIFDGTSDNSRTVLVDGFWAENVDLTTANHLSLQSTQWLNRINGNTGAHTVHLGTTDNCLENLWIQGPADTSFDAIHADGSRELSFLGMIEVSASGTTRHLVRMNDVTESYFQRLWLEGATDTREQMKLTSCQNVQFGEVAVDRDNIVIGDGCAEVHFGDVLLLTGKVQIDGTGANGVQDVHLGHLKSEGSFGGLEILGNGAQRITAHITSHEDLNDVVLIQGDDCYITGTIVNPSGHGVMFNGEGAEAAERNVFYGTATGAADEDVQFFNDSEKCAAFGRFGTVLIDGTGAPNYAAGHIDTLILHRGTHFAHGVCTDLTFNSGADSCEFYGGVTNSITLESGATDCNFYCIPPSITDNGATRPRWMGVIGGGPLGGVDLSSTTGQFEGDAAVADGTSASANAGDRAYWDATNTQWRVHQHEATV